MNKDEIKQLRERMNLSQEDFARRLDVSTPTVQRWEKGKFVPSKLAEKQLLRLSKKVIRSV